jgi:hypothetical protein
LDLHLPIAIGSGEERFHEEYNKLIETPREKRAIVALKNVIDGREIPSVGGNIQYGESRPRCPFSIKGIVVPEFRQDGTPSVNHFCLGGIDVLDDVFNERHGLFVSGGFITPFDHILF